MRALAGRSPRLRHVPRGIRPRVGAPRPPKPRIRRKRRWPTVLAVLTAAIAIWILWPVAVEQSDGPRTSPSKVAGSRAEGGRPEKPQTARPVTAAAPPRPKTAERSPVFRARRELLLAAIRARAASLRPCVPADAAELHVPVRLHVLRNGPVKSVEFPGEPPARELRDCVRRIATGWSFQDVELPADLELFATLALSPGAWLAQ